jgi:hypothetical protein
MWEAWEREYGKREPWSYEENLRIDEMSYAEAVRVGALPPKNPLEGIEHKIRVARVLNALGNPN